MDPNNIQQGMPPQEMSPQVMPPEGMPPQAMPPQVMPPGMEGMGDSGQMQEMQNMIGNIRGQVGEFDANKKAAGDKLEILKQEALKMVFELLESAGVDLEDQASVSEFLAKLKENDPQLASWFEESIGMILNDTDEEPQEPVDLPTGPGLNVMNYENKQPNTIEETPQILS